MTIIKKYKNFDALMQNIIDVYIEGENFTVLCNYEIANKIIKKFLSFNDKTKPYLIDIDNPECGAYVDEYAVSNIGTDLYCKKARRNGKPITCGGNTITFVQRDFVGADFIKYDCIPNIYFSFEIKED